jgi:hypothetical protein
MSIKMDRPRKARLTHPVRASKARIGMAFAGLALAATLSGCERLDPFHREGIWTPSGVNNANIAAQVANPADLARGRADSSGSVRSATTAVERLWQSGPAQRPPGQAQQPGSPFAPRQGAGEAPR